MKIKTWISAESGKYLVTVFSDGVLWFISVQLDVNILLS